MNFQYYYQKELIAGYYKIYYFNTAYTFFHVIKKVIKNMYKTLQHHCWSLKFPIGSIDVNKQMDNKIENVV